MYHSRSRRIERVDKQELIFYKVFLICHEDFIMHDNYFSFLLSLSITTIIYIIESDIWLNPKGFIPRQRLD